MQQLRQAVNFGINREALVRIYGGEVALTTQFLRGLAVKAGYTYLHTRVFSDQEELQYVPTDKATLSARYDFKFGFTPFVSAQYVAGTYVYSKRNFFPVLKKTMADTEAIFGGELSGHFYFRDNFYADSGAIAFARVLSVLSSQSKPLGELIAPLRRYAQSGEMNFQIDDKDGKIRELAETYRTAQVDYLDGITVEGGDWWFNVRQSNTEPLLRLNLEATTPRLLQERFTELMRLLGEPLHGH